MTFERYFAHYWIFWKNFKTGYLVICSSNKDYKIILLSKSVCEIFSKNEFCKNNHLPIFCTSLNILEKF